MLQLILAVRDVVRVFIVLIEVGFFFSATASTAQMMQNSSTVLEQGTSTQTTTHGKELKFIRTFSVSFCCAVAFKCAR